MNILFAASEAAPFIKTGGLGDVAQSLPQQLEKDENIEVRVVIPYYKSIKENPNFKVSFLTSFGVDLAWRRVHVGVFTAVYKGVTYYLVDNEFYFYRDGCYGYYDDGERFAYFSKAILEMLMHIDFAPDIIHINDWQTALVPAFLRAQYCHMQKYSHIRTVLTIHNIEYQGKVPNEFLSYVLGMDEGMRNVLTYGDCLNFLKSAIVLCDKITTVSKTYSFEIRYAYYAHGLEKILEENSYKLCGITNGINTDIFNPNKDKNIYVNYKAGEVLKKQDNKLALQKDLGLEQNPDIPMVSMITRLVSHKGLDLVECVSKEIMDLGVQFVVVGTGDEKYENHFRHMAYVYPGKVSANIKFDTALASKVYAGSDIFLMPSKSEPCGLSQLIAMRYGTIPVVRETGGLFDTVPALNTDTLEGRGFTFKVYNAHDMLDAVRRAVDFYHDKVKYTKVVKNIMKYDCSWKKAASEYINVYGGII